MNLCWLILVNPYPLDRETCKRQRLLENKESAIFSVLFCADT